MLSDLWTAHQRHVFQFARYGMAGVLATATQWAVFYTLSHFVLEAVDPALGDAVRSRNFGINTTIAFLISNTVAYILNAKWVFEPGRHRRSKEIGLFFLVSGISLTLGMVLSRVMILDYGINSHLTQFSFTVTAVLVNYVCRKFIIFKG